MLVGAYPPLPVRSSRQHCSSPCLNPVIPWRILRMTLLSFLAGEMSAAFEIIEATDRSANAGGAAVKLPLGR